MDWVVSTFWQLWIMVLWTFMCKFLCGYMFPILSRSDVAGSYGNSMFTHLKNCQTVFPKFPRHCFTLPPAVYEGPNVSTYSSTLAIVCLFDFSHPSGCELVSYCGFGLHYPSGWSCRVSFHVLTDHLYVITGEMSIEIPCPLTYF